MDNLVVSFEDVEVELWPGEELVFGRDADLCVDESNMALHRAVGRLRHEHGAWWLDNVGRSIEMRAAGWGTTRSVVPPGGIAALTGQHVAVEFAAGRAQYRLELVVGQPAEPVPAFEPGPRDTEHPTATRAQFSPGQLALLAALCEPALIDPLRRDDVPSNQEIAVRLGIGATAVQRRLDGICLRLAATGFVGLRGSKGNDAVDRKRRVVSIILNDGVVDASDLPTGTS